MRFFAGVSAIIGWGALVLQYVLLVQLEDGLTFAQHTANFFSYFTILSNILAALMMTAAFFQRGPFLRRPAVQTAIAVYMTITGLIYLFVLAPLWAPTGLAFVCDALLHYAQPAAVIVFWLFFVRHARSASATCRGFSPSR